MQRDWDKTTFWLDAWNPPPGTRAVVVCQKGPKLSEGVAAILPLPDARFPTQLEECYAALKWVAAHGDEIGADGSRIAVAGNSVGGNMAAALALMSKDRGGPAIAFQALLIPRPMPASIPSPISTMGPDGSWPVIS